MALLTGCLFLVFGSSAGVRPATTPPSSRDASSLKPGDSVRVAGVRVGTVETVTLRDDNTAVVSFDTDEDVVLTTGSRAAVRYLNLVGDRYLELLDGPGSTQALTRGAQCRSDQTEPALDLDLLLGGLKPVIRGLDPRDVNALTNALLQIFQGQGDTLQSLLSKTSSFSNTLADNNTALESTGRQPRHSARHARQGWRAVLRRARQVPAAHHRAGRRPRHHRHRDRLVEQRHRVDCRPADQRPGSAGGHDRPAQSAGAAGGQGQGPASTLRCRRAPENYRKLARVGSYGSFVNYYLCGINIRVTDLQGRTAVFPWIKQRDGRCAEP